MRKSRKEEKGRKEDGRMIRAGEGVFSEDTGWGRRNSTRMGKEDGEGDWGRS